MCAMVIQMKASHDISEGNRGAFAHRTTLKTLTARICMVQCDTGWMLVGRTRIVRKH